MNTDDGMAGLIGLVIFLAIYFLPWIVAITRNHHQRAAICVVNLFLGWTLIGWVVALAWAYTAPREPRQGIVQEPRQRGGIFQWILRNDPAHETPRQTSDDAPVAGRRRPGFTDAQQGVAHRH